MVQLRSGWRNPAWLDTAAALLLLALGQVEVWAGVRFGGIGSAVSPGRPVEALAVVAATLPLAVRRRWPLPVAAAVCGAVATEATLVGQTSLLAGLLPVLVVVYSAAVHARRPRGVSALLCGLAVQLTFVLRIPEERVAGELMFGLFVLVGSWLVGDLVRSRQQHADRAVGELVRVEAEREAWAARALADEREAIARELHDVIAHGVSVMGVQAAGARILVDRDLGAAKESMRGIEAQARECVGELQRLLGVLRDSPDGDDRHPQPGLGQLPALIDQMTAAGLGVTLDVHGSPERPPAGVDLAAYRVVQEALTNVLKHAGSVPTTVTVRYGPTSVSVVVQNEDRTSNRPVPATIGHGLVGMQERVGLYGGLLETGRLPDGSFRVAASIPLLTQPAVPLAALPLPAAPSALQPSSRMGRHPRVVQHSPVVP